MVRRERVEPTEDWDQLVLLFEWPEQQEYEPIRQPMLFGTSVAERARESGTPERTLYWKVEQVANADIRRLLQPRLFGLEEALGDGWLKALKLEGYATRSAPAAHPDYL